MLSSAASTTNFVFLNFLFSFHVSEGRVLRPSRFIFIFIEAAEESLPLRSRQERASSARPSRAISLIRRRRKRRHPF